MPSKVNKVQSEMDSDAPFSESEDENVDNESDDSEEEMEDTFEEGQQNKHEKKRRKVTDGVTDDIPKKKKKLEKDLYKAPTVEELNQLRETENLFHSNLFRLQIEEMLAEIKVKDKYKKLFDAWFLKLKEAVNSIEETDEVHVADDLSELSKKLETSIPIHQLSKDAKCVFKFLKPENIETIGSYSFGATVGPTITIDIMVEMPSKVFQKQDYQNYRYLRKKAIYLAYVASSIQNDIAESKKFMGDTLRPFLKIVPTGKLGKKVTVHLHVSANENSFKLTRFSPEKNNVRPAWYFSNAEYADDLPPTPHYNSIILRDLSIARTNAEIKNIINEYPNVRDGIILLKVWLRQRELIKGYDGFNGHIITMFVLYLLSIKKLNTFMSSYQIVRNVWNHLAYVSWSETGLAMSADNADKVEEYKKYFDCVFLDSNGYNNIAAYITKNTFSWIQREADICLKHLESAHADSFQSLFMRKIPFYRAFDHFLCIKPDVNLKVVIAQHANRDEVVDYGSNKWALALKYFYKILQEGLTNRIHRICKMPEEYTEWDCKNYKERSKKLPILIGLELNPDNCFGIVDKGPEANLPEAAKFRNFWAGKSDLRRFQDGSIREAVVWSEGKSLAERRVICKAIVNHLLVTKFNLTKKSYTYIANQMEDLLKLQKVEIKHLAYGSGEEASLQVIKTFDALEKELMSLTDIPLSIHGVQGSSAVFRYTDVFPPLATKIPPKKGVTQKTGNYLTLKESMTEAPPYVPALEVTLQLSTSGKWPDDLGAIRKTKAAFHLQIAECLRKQHSLIAYGHESYIDVMKDGFIFRLRIAHQKEIALVKQQVDEQGVIKYRDNEESIALESLLFDLPKLNSALHGLHNQQPSFGATCGLVKRWLSAHMLDNSLIPDVAVELLVASMFLVPVPYKPSQMPQVAFLRMLDLFARAHWNTDPIIVNFNSEMTKEEIVAVETLFGSSRSSLPPLFISTPYDQQKSLWTRKAPSHLILNRISALAKESLKIFEDKLYTDMINDLKPMFRPSLSEYDCLIRLKPSMVPRKLQAVDVPAEHPVTRLHPFEPHPDQLIPVINFDPVQSFLKDLRDGYSEFALFFHDTCGGAVIGVLLKPDVLEPRDFKVSNINCRKYDNSGKLVLNISMMIQDFYILGKGLVDSIDVSPSKVTLS